MVTRSHIENIRKSVKQEGDYKPTAEVIRTAILNICPDAEDILRHKMEIVQEVVRMSRGELSTQVEEETLIVSEVETTDTQLVEFSLDETMEIEDDDTLNAESKLVVSDQDKQNLVYQQAQEMGIQLSQTEVITIVESVELNSDTVTEYIEEVEPAIRAFIKFKESQDLKKVDRFITNIKSEMSQSNQRIQKKMETGMQDIHADLGGVRASWKRAKELTLERVRIPVNS
jgi:hypothetical protein